MRKIQYGLIIFCLVTFSCNNLEYQIEKAHLEVMEVHDEVMPKQSTISAAQLSIKKWLDVQDSTQIVPPEISTLLTQLADAEEAMWSWMNQYSKPKKSNTDEAIAYLEKQKASIEKVRDQMLNSLTRYEDVNKKYNF